MTAMKQTPAEIAEIAGKLSEAQKRWLSAAILIWPHDGRADGQVWVTYPPTNTCVVLHRLGLWRWDGCLLPLGLAVRAHLEQGQGD